MRVPDPWRSRAVLIGVGDYAHPDLEAMPAAAAGAHRLAGLLRDPSVWGLPEEHLTVLSHSASGEQVLAAVRDAALAAEDTLLVYFAGHGLRDRGERLYLALADADADYPQIGTLPYLQLRDVIRQSGYRARHRVTVLDCCFSGLAGGMAGSTAPTRSELARALDESARPDGDGEREAPNEDGHGDYVLTSAPATSRSFVPPGAPFPEFTGELIDALETGIADAGDTMSLEATWLRARARMRHRGSPEPQQFAQNTVARQIHLHNRAARPAPGPRPPRPAWPGPPPARPPAVPQAAAQQQPPPAPAVPPYRRPWTVAAVTVAVVGVTLLAWLFVRNTQSESAGDTSAAGDAGAEGSGDRTGQEGTEHEDPQEPPPSTEPPPEPAETESASASPPPEDRERWSGEVILSYLDLDTVPPTVLPDNSGAHLWVSYDLDDYGDGSIEEAEMFGAQGGFFTSLATISLWEEEKEPTRQECADHVTTRAAETLPLTSGDRFCVTSAAGRIAFITVGQENRAAEAYEAELLVWEDPDT